MQAGTQMQQMTTAKNAAANGPPVHSTRHLPTLPTWSLVALIIVCAVLASALLPD